MQPRLIFKEDTEKSLEAKLPKSTNNVTKVKYDNQFVAYKKPISNKLTPSEAKSDKRKLSPFEAKYEVASCVFQRLSNKRVNDVRLVFNTKNELSGIAAIHLLDFTSMQKILDPDASDPAIQALTCPTLETLIKDDINATELLTCAGIFDEIDLNENNFHIKAGLIDKGQSFFNDLMRYFNHDFIDELGDPIDPITVERLELLPDAEGRRYWPSRVPLNTKSVDVTRTLKSISAFKALPNQEKSQNQKYFYFLQVLISFDKELLKNQLKLYFGDMPLNYKELPEAFIKRYPRSLFFDGDNERSFADHCATFFERYYTRLLNRIVHMPKFRKFLIDHPKAILDIKRWAAKCNENKEDAATQAFPYRLSNLDKLYNIFFRDAFVKPICEQISKFETLITGLDPKIPHSYEVINDPKKDEITISESSSLPKKSDSTSTQEPLNDEELPVHLLQSTIFVSKLPSIKSKEEEDKKLDKQEENSYRKFRSFYKRLSRLTQEYYQLRNPTYEENHSYIRQVIQLLRVIYTHVQASLNDQDKLPFCFVIDNLQKIMKTFWREYIEVPEHLTESFCLLPPLERTQSNMDAKADNEATKAELFEPIVDLITRLKMTLPSSDKPFTFKVPELIEKSKNSLEAWLPTLNHEQINNIVTQTLTEYKPMDKGILGYINPRAIMSVRSGDIIELQKKHHGIELIHEIIFQKTEGFWNNEPGWKETSYNTRLIKNLCLKMFEEQDEYKITADELVKKNLSNRREEIDQVRAQIIQPGFSWESIAEGIAKKIDWIPLRKNEKTKTTKNVDSETNSPSTPVCLEVQSAISLPLNLGSDSPEIITPSNNLSAEVQSAIRMSLN